VEENTLLKSELQSKTQQLEKYVITVDFNPFSLQWRTASLTLGLFCLAENRRTFD
jgi:hypothetical protein